MPAALSRPLDREDRYIKRNERSIASLVSLLVHLLFVLALLYSSKLELAQTESSSSGGARVKVDFLGDTTQDDTQPPVPPTGAKTPRERPKPLKPLVTTPVTSPVDTTRVTEAENPVAPDETQPQPPASQQAIAPPQNRPPSSPPAWRRSAQWGQPPGMLAQDTAPDNYGRTVGTGLRQGNNQGNAATPSMEVDGHQNLLRPAQRTESRRLAGPGHEGSLLPPARPPRTDGLRLGDRGHPRLRRLPPDATQRPRPGHHRRRPRRGQRDAHLPPRRTDLARTRGVPLRRTP
ncbi:hypothetical protein [Pseudoxanthomonas mexicana]